MTLTGDLLRDLGHALRQFSRAPRFVILAASCLGLGIAVNTAMFAVLDAVVLRPLEGAQSERLVRLSRGPGATFTYPAYQDYVARASVTAMSATLPMESDLEIDGAAEFVTAEVVSGSYGEVFGIRPVLGQWPTNETDPSAVISHSVWLRHFDGSPTVLGRQIRSESQVYTIVAVAPPEFTGMLAPLRTDIWVPLRTRPGIVGQLDDRRQRPLFMLFGRLRPGATTSQAAAELNGIEGQLKSDSGTSSEFQFPLAVEEVRGFANPGARRAAASVATLLSAVVGIVLVIAAVNVGNLVLARGAIRRREWAIRRALGATRFRIARHVLAESVLLAMLGGICGVVVASWINRLLERSLPSLTAGVDLQLNLALDWRVLLFTAGITVGTTLFCGLLPAWRSSRTAELMSLRCDLPDRGFRRRMPWGVIVQVALSLALLLAAGTLLHASLRMQASDPGFVVADRVYVQAFVPSPPLTREQARDFHLHAVERLRAVPGVGNAALSSFLPLVPARSDCAANAEANPRIPITKGVVDVGFLAVLGVRLVSGRDFTPADTNQAEPVVIVNQRLATQLWPNEQAVGRVVLIGCRETQRAVVVAVARDAAVGAVGEAPRPQMFQPFVQQYSGGLVTMVIQTNVSPALMVEPIRRTLRELGQAIRIYGVRPLSEHVERSYGPLRWQAAVVTIFGVLALVLAAFGLYGVTTYGVTLRVPEIGIRMALGAGRGDIFRGVMGQGLRIVLIGIGAGGFLVFALARLLGSLQSNIVPPGPLLYAGAAVLWIATAFVAIYLPAQRASRVDPLIALRWE